MISRQKRWWWGLLLALAAPAGLIEAVAALRVRHLRAERAAPGDRLYTEVRGHGDPVVFLAGLPGTTRFWQGAFEPLAARRRLIFVDALGFGRSPLPAVDYTLEDHLGALRRTLVHLGATRRVTFVAHSSGAVLAAYYAARYPADVAGLVLLGTPIFDDEREARRRIAAASPMGGLFTLNPVFARAGCKLHEATLSPLLARIVSWSRPELPPEVAAEGLLHTWRSFNGTLRHVLLARPIAVPLAQLGPKVTFVHGRADWITPLPRLQALAAAAGAGLAVTGDDHTSYPRRSAEQIVAAVLSSAPESPPQT
jgi:pimeloyl-ACP methyl ester carboxylesterase